MTRGARALLCLALGACSPKPVAPKPPATPLATTSLPALAQGPGARWAVVAAPKALLAGGLGPRVRALLPSDGLDKLERKLGFDLRQTSDALVVGYAATTFYAAHLPVGTAPSGPLEAFEQRVLPPLERANLRADLVRVWGSMPSGVRGSAAGMWSSQGDAIVGEGGRLGPVVTAMALAAGKLSPERALSMDRTFGPLLAWAKSAEVALLARCPFSEALGGPSEPDPGARPGNVLLEECFGVALTLHPAADGRLTLAARATGAWGKDAPAAAEAMRATYARIAESDLGRVLGLREATPVVTASPDAVDASVALGAATFADGLRRMLSAEIGDATK